MARAAVLETTLVVNDKEFRSKMESTRTNVKGLGDDAKETGGDIKEGFGIGVVAVAALGASIIGLTVSLTEAAAELSVLSDTSQVTITAFQRLLITIKENGGNLEQANKVIQIARRNLFELAEGAGVGYDALTRLGLVTEDFAGLDVDQQVLKIVDALQKLNDANERGVLITSIFGEEDSRAIYGLINKDLTDLNERIDEYTILSEKAGIASRRFQADLDQLTTSYTNALTNSLAEAGVFDSLSDLFNGLTAGISDLGAFDALADGISLVTDNIDLLLEGAGLLAAFYASSVGTAGAIKFYTNLSERVKETNLSITTLVETRKQELAVARASIETEQASIRNARRQVTADADTIKRVTGITNAKQALATTNARIIAANRSGDRAEIAAQLRNRRLIIQLTAARVAHRAAIKASTVAISDLTVGVDVLSRSMTRLSILTTKTGALLTRLAVTVGSAGLSIAKIIPGMILFQIAFSLLDEAGGLFLTTLDSVSTGLRRLRTGVEEVDETTIEFIKVFEEANDLLLTYDRGLIDVAKSQASLGEETKLATEEILRQQKVLEDRARAIDEANALIQGPAGDFNPFLRPTESPETPADTNITEASVEKLIVDTQKLIDITTFELAERAARLQEIARAPLNQFGGVGAEQTILQDAFAQFESEERERAIESLAAQLQIVATEALNEFGGIGDDISIRLNNSSSIAADERDSRLVDLLRDSLNAFGGAGEKIAVSVDELAIFLEGERAARLADDARANLNEFGGEGEIIVDAITGFQLALEELAESTGFRRESSPEFELEQINLFKAGLRDQIRTGFTDLFKAGLNNTSLQDVIEGFARGLAETIVDRIADSVFNTFADSLFDQIGLGAASSISGGGGFGSQSVLGLFTGALGAFGGAPTNPELSAFGGAGPDVSSLGGASAPRVTPGASFIGGAQSTTNNISVGPSFIQEVVQLASDRPDIFGQAAERYRQDVTGSV